MEGIYEHPEAPPIPEPQSLHLGLVFLALTNLVLLVFVLLNGFAPLFGGGIVSVLSVPIGRVEELARPGEPKGPQREQVEREERRETFLKYWKLHFVVAMASVPVAVGLLRCSYFAAQREFAYGELRLWLICSAVLILINLFLGWGGVGSAGFLGLTIAELTLMHVPSVQFYMVEATDEQKAIARGKYNGDNENNEVE